MGMYIQKFLRFKALVSWLLLSWVNCENKTLECSLGPETPSTQVELTTYVGSRDDSLERSGEEYSPTIVIS